MKPHDLFVKELKDISPFITVLDSYSGSFNPIRCICTIHNTEFMSMPTHLLNGQCGCPICRGERISQQLIKSNEQFLNELKDVNPNVKVMGQYKGANKHIQTQCLRCKNTWEPTPSTLLKGYGCPHCMESKGEKAVKYILNKLSINYVSQQKFDGLRGVGNHPLSYDFYLPDYNLLIEYQGQYHDHSVEFQTDDAYNTQREHDKRKREYANNNHINLLEIWYYDFNNIERIIVDYLKNLNPVTTTVA